MESRLTIAEIALIAATRPALGAGVGLLVSNRLNEDHRKAAGIALALVGGLTTIPLVLTVARRKVTAPTELRSVA
jgi:acetaldehyde dehydrogenase (acetylating)